MTTRAKIIESVKIVLAVVILLFGIKLLKAIKHLPTRDQRILQHNDSVRKGLTKEPAILYYKDFEVK